MKAKRFLLLLVALLTLASNGYGQNSLGKVFNAGLNAILSTMKDKKGKRQIEVPDQIKNFTYDRKEQPVSDKENGDNTSSQSEPVVEAPVSRTCKDDVTIVTTGNGTTKEDATKKALRSAIEQVYGTFVSSNTSLVNDDLVRDDVVTISSGNIKSYSELACALLPNGMQSVTVEAVVSISNLATYAKSKGASVEFAGATFGMNMKIQELNRISEQIALSNLLEQIKSFLPIFYDRKLIVEEPTMPTSDFNVNDNAIDKFYDYAKYNGYANGNEAVIRRDKANVKAQMSQWLNSNSYLVTMHVKYENNDNTNSLINYIKKTLKAISLSTDDINSRANVGLGCAPYKILGSTFYFRNSLSYINNWNRQLAHAFYGNFLNFMIVDNLGVKSYFEGYDERLKYVRAHEFSKYTDFLLLDVKSEYYSYVLKGYGLLSPFFKMDDYLLEYFTCWDKFDDSDFSGPHVGEGYSQSDSGDLETSIFNLGLKAPELVLKFLVPANEISKYSNFALQDKN